MSSFIPVTGNREFRRTDRYVSIKLITGHGVSQYRYFAVLGMPLVKRVTRAGPAGKPVIGSEPKLLSEPTFRRIYRGKEDLLIFENRRLRNGMFP